MSATTSKKKSINDLLVFYVREFCLVYVVFFVAKKYLNVQNLLVLVFNVKIRKKICTKTANFSADFDFMN
jgi:hypothetical protein